jgi:hypothetical protein
LILRVRDGSGDECGKVGGNDLVSDLEPLGGADPVLEVRLVVDPVTQEGLLVRG